jgi:hypothetical protein
MPTHENHPSRPVAPSRTRSRILRSAVALLTMALGLYGSATPIFASPPTVPDAPTIDGITMGHNSVTVDFTANSDGGDTVTGFAVTCDSTDGGTTRSVTDVASPITVSALDNGNTYSCTVLATNSVGDSAASDPSDDFVAITVPDAPTISGVTRGSNSAIVSFTANADGGDEIVFYKATCTSSTGGTTRSKTGVSSPLTVVSLSNGRTYTCTVVATNSIGNSAASVASASFVAGTTPAAPTVSGVTRGNDSAIVTVSLNATGGVPITNYSATCTSSDGGTTQSASNATSPVTVGALTNGKNYTCTSYVTNSFGDSPSSGASSSILAAAFPAAPTLTSVTRGLNSVDVAFTPNSDGGDAITGYTATCASSDGGTTQSNTGATSPITVGSLDNGNTYTCVVVATNSVGDGSASSASASFVAATAPDAPSITGVTRGQNSAIVAFTANADGSDPITGFTATCASSDGGTTRSATGASSPITVGSLTNTNTYTCTAVATNGFGDSAASTASSSFVGATVPVAPTLSSITLGLNSVDVAFSANGNGGDTITGYTATCTSSDGGTTQAVSGATSPITVASLTNSKTYTCAAVATNAIGDSAASTDSSSFIAATVPNAPSITGVTRGPNAAIVALSANGDGGNAVTSYTATCVSSDGGTTQSALNTTSPVMVGSLDNGNTYTCTAVATNDFGDSAASAASSAFVVATVPDAPGLTTVDLGSNSAIVAFTANANGGDTISGYTVTCTSSDGGDPQSASDTASPITVTSLSNGNSYTCAAVATNSVGDSAPSADSGPFVAIGLAEAPTITSVDLNLNSVTVEFIAGSDGGDSVSSFTVTCASSDGGAMQSTTDTTSPITVSSLSSGNTYTCTMIATNGFGDSAVSDATSPFVAAGGPVAPSITGVTLGSNSAIVAFISNGDGGDPIFGYRVTCRSSNGGLSRATSGAASPITVSPLSNGRTYTCKVVASNSIANSAASAASSSFVAGTVPVAPSLTGVTRGTNSAIVAFTANGNGGSAITGFTATCTSSDGGATQSASNATSPITVGSLTNANTYTCTVVATNATGNSAASTASSSFVAATTPSAPSITSVGGGNNSAVVTFTAGSDGGDTVTGFTATCTSSNGGTTQALAGATSPITVASLTNGKTYTCTVVATNAMGDSAASVASDSLFAGTVPVAPSLTGVTPGTNSVDVAFTANGSGGSAILFFTATCVSSDGGATRSAANSSSPVSVGALSNAETYACTVTATNSTGESAASTASSSFVAVSPPAAPSITGVAGGNNSAVVSFAANSDGGSAITGFTATCTSSDGGTTQALSGATSPITVASLTDAKTYTCTVVATNAVGNSSASAASSSVLSGTVPAAPSLTSVTRGTNSAIVAFTANGSGGSAITGFTATCTSSDGGATQALSGATSPITVASLTNAKTYTCTVLATNATGNSPASSASSSFVAASAATSPSVTGVTLGNNSGVVAFTANSNGGSAITSFTATCTSSNGGTTQALSGATSPITVASLTNAKTYTCTVTATNAMGTSPASAASSSFVATTQPVAPSAPTITSITHTAGQVVIVFTAGANGGSVITGFTATCIPTTGSNMTASGSKSPLTVTGLTVGMHYACRVTATNAFGTSVDSNPFTFTD